MKYFPWSILWWANHRFSFRLQIFFVDLLNIRESMFIAYYDYYDTTNIRKKDLYQKTNKQLAVCVNPPFSFSLFFLCCIFIFMQLDVCLGNVWQKSAETFLQHCRVPSISAICPCSSVAVPLPGPGRLGKVRMAVGISHEGSEWEWYTFRHVHEWLMFYGINADLAGGNSKIFYVHPEPWGRFPIWLIFFKGVETTN